MLKGDLDHLLLVAAHLRQGFGQARTRLATKGGDSSGATGRTGTATGLAPGGATYQDSSGWLADAQSLAGEEKTEATRKLRAKISAKFKQSLGERHGIVRVATTKRGTGTTG